jgi:hypothetical protein
MPLAAGIAAVMVYLGVPVRTARPRWCQKYARRPESVASVGLVAVSHTLCEKLKAEFELEKAKYDQQRDEIAERERSICSEEVTNLAQAQRLDELCLQLTDDSCHYYLRFRK